MANIIAFEDKSDVNKESYRLTVEQIRSFPDFKNVSDEEIIEIRDTLYEFCLIVYEYISRDQTCTPENIAPKAERGRARLRSEIY